MTDLNVHAVANESFVNGPGSRFVIWTQGCTKGCVNCFNPRTWPFKNRGTEMDPVILAMDVLMSGAEGLTISGGDPLEQPKATFELLRALHDEEGDVMLPRGIIVFTGYTWEEIKGLEGEDGQYARSCLNMIDVLIDGRYVDALRYPHHLAGSSNQRFHFNPKTGRGKALIGEDAIITDQSVEILSTENDVVEVTGFPNVDKATLEKLGLRVIQ